MVFLITYDLNRPGQDYESLYEAIKSLGSWAHPLDSVWLVVSSLEAQQIFNRLRLSMDNSDELFVVQLREHWWANFDQRVIEWLQIQTF